MEGRERKRRVWLRRVDIFLESERRGRVGVEMREGADVGTRAVAVVDLYW